jgi:photosystem II stability/assembly factor-like uncharacterized protein
MKTLTVIFLLILSYISSSQCIYWEQQTFPQRGNVFSLQFFDLNTGYVVCAGSTNFGEWNFIKTTNSGSNWIDVGSGIYQSLNGLSFINKDTGYVGGLNYFARTFNGGLNWTRLNIGSNNPLGTYDRLKFFDLNFGYVYGNSGGIKILKTTNGALSWDTLLHTGNPFTSNIFAFTILNKDTIIVAGYSHLDLGFVKVTHNGGLNWYLIDSLPWPVTGVSFLNNTHGLLCATNSVSGFANGKYFLTTNTGLNWVLKETGFAVPFSKSKYIDSNTYFFIDWDGGLYFTTNSGINWTFRDCFNFGAGAPGGILFINPQTGWVSGSFGPYTSAMFKTTNGGLTFIQSSLNNVPASFELFQNYPNPFNPITTINFSIPIVGLVKLTVYDINGKEVQKLVNKELLAGTYSTEFEAGNLSSGVYFYILQSGSFSTSRKMILIK